MMKYIRLTIVALAALSSTGCATAQWTRDKLEITEDRLRAITIEQFAEYERQHQTGLGEIDQRLIQLDTKLGLLEDSIPELQENTVQLHEQFAVLSTQYHQHAERSETDLETIGTLADSLEGSLGQLITQVSAIEQESRNLKHRWSIEAETAQRWHRGLVTMLLDAIARTAVEPTDEERQGSPAVNRLSSLLRQMALDMRTQLDVSRGPEHRSDTVDSTPRAVADDNDES